ncbi:MAG TPA: PadR family transcriptional regulator [Solirubrobacteraceae bacterium]|jgi:DNA-binding PadR family transcriptional regulator
MPKLTPFSYAVLVLVGEGGAGAHDLVRMMRQGQHVFWAASASQWYAEPKRLSQLGLLDAERTPGRTHDRTHYTLTDAGREALRTWLAQPSAFPRIQSEPVVRLLGAEFADPEALSASLDSLRAPLAEGYAALEAQRAVVEDLPHRASVIAINHRLARRILDAHAEWLEEAQAMLGDAAGR